MAMIKAEWVCTNNGILEFEVQFIGIRKIVKIKNITLLSNIQKTPFSLAVLSRAPETSANLSGSNFFHFHAVFREILAK